MDRRDFLKVAGIASAGTVMGIQRTTPGQAVLPRRAVQPFRLNQVTLGDGLFRDKRDRMLNYARNYESATDIYAGPDRMLSNFRATAGLDTKGAQPRGAGTMQRDICGVTTAAIS
jgi:hypothetical protein